MTIKNPLKNLSKKELRELLNHVLHDAVSSQYFGEAHKHRAHLWDITNRIDPEIAKLIGEGEESKAFNITAKRIGLQ